MRIESGPSPERARRLTIFAAALIVGTVWFAYDGWIGWPERNRRDFLLQCPNGTSIESVKTSPIVTEAFARQLGKPASLEDVERKVGQPPAVRTDLDARWFGVAGTMAIELQNGRPSAPAIFKNSAKTDTDLLFQRGLAVALAVASVIAAWQWARVRRARYVLDDAGLAVASTEPISWDAMKRLDTDRYVEKGWVDLHYSNGGEHQIRLDSFEIGAFDEIIDELCRRKGFENPLPVESGPAPRQEP